MLLNAAMVQKSPAPFVIQAAAQADGKPDAPDYSALLLSVAQNQDKASFIKIFDHFAPRVKSYLMRGGTSEEFADELAQETMLAVWDKAASFNPTKAAASTWIFTIARNKKIDALRKGARFDVNLDDIADQQADKDTPSITDTLVQNDETQQIAAALNELPPEQADLIRQSFFEDKSHSEIAAEKNLPLGTVKSRLRLALERLRKNENVRKLWQ